MTLTSIDTTTSTVVLWSRLIPIMACPNVKTYYHVVSTRNVIIDHEVNLSANKIRYSDVITLM